MNTSISLSADAMFSIGSQHVRSGLPCQDYALSGSIGSEAVYAILADGCSTGGKTDVGARMTALATAQAIHTCMATRTAAFSTAFVEEIVVRESLVQSSAMQMLGLHVSDMLATNLFALVTTTHGGIVHLRGDGVLAYVYADGTTIMRAVEWHNNTPLYPAYAYDHFAGFMQAHGGNRSQEVVTHTVRIVESGKILREEVQHYSLAEGIRGYTHILLAEDIQNVQFVALFTDGVMHVEGREWHTVVSELLAYKSLSGDFVKRRMNRFLKDARSVEGGTRIHEGPLDDISCATIHITTT